MKIFFGKNRKSAKKISLKEVILKHLDIKNPKISLEKGRFSDNSASWINISKEIENINKGAKLDICVTFDPENDSVIQDVQIFISDKLFGYDEENMKELK